MFYEKEIDYSNLRFGDVLKGFITSIIKISNPVIPEKFYQYNLEITMSEYTVILSPCCSIGPSVISLTPLLKIKSSFLKNSFFAVDFTRINYPLEPENQLPPSDWEKKSPEEKARRKAAGLSYALVDYFIYDKNDFFPEFKLRSTNIRYYMIDFRKICQINCPKIKSNGRIEEDLKAHKLLQLSVDTRSALRSKIGHFYTRIPEEDKILLE